MRLKDSRKTSAPSATVWWNVRMASLRLVVRRRTPVLVLCPFRSVSRRPTMKWRNICDRAIRSCSATCCIRPATSCTTVSPCLIAGTKPADASRVRFWPLIVRFCRNGHSGANFTYLSVRFSRIGQTGIKIKRSCVRITRIGHRSAWPIAVIACLPYRYTAKLARNQLNPTTCSATKYPLRITNRPSEPCRFSARDIAFLRTSA